MKKTTVIQGEKEVPVEIIANSIKAISAGIKALRNGPLNDRALVLLIQHAAPKCGGQFGNSNIGTREIRGVFEGIENLERTYLKRKKE